MAAEHASEMEIYVYVECEMPPTIAKQEEIRNTLYNLLYSLDSRAKIEIKSGFGSWWTSAYSVIYATGIWFFAEISKWFVKAGLDAGKAYLHSQNQRAQLGGPEALAPIVSLECQTVAVTSSNPTITEGNNKSSIQIVASSDNNNELSGSFEYMEKYAIKEMTWAQLNPETMQTGEESLKRVAGRIVSLKLENGERKVQLINTYTKEDFDSFIKR